MSGNTMSGGSVYPTNDVRSGVASPPRAQGAGKAPDKFRKTGIDFLGNVPWGTHLCQFYQTKQDLLDIAVPYFKAGLENNEFCVWVAADPLDPREAFEAMISAWPSCEQFLERGQIRFLSHNQWYLREGSFDPQRMVETSVDIVNRALKSGYEGMRIASNMGWVEKREWQTLSEFEAKADRLDGAYPMLAICSYHLDKCGSAEVIDVIRHHRAAILKHGKGWQLMQNPANGVVVEAIQGNGDNARKLMNEALIDSEEQMQAVFEGVRDAIVLLDMAGKIIRVNKSAPELLGYAEQDFIGKQFALLKVFPTSRAAEMFSAQARTLAGHDVPPFELEAIADSGHKLDVEVRISPMKREGRVVGAIAVIRDITERRKTEDKLRASQDRNQLVVQNANEGIMVIQDGTVKLANPKMMEIVGYSAEEILLKPVTELIHPEDRRTVMAGQFKRLRGEELAHIQDLRVIDKFGNTKWAEFNAVLFAWDGRPADLYFVNDITERKQAQEALIQSEQNYKYLFESTLEGLEVVDGETGKIVLANPACAKVFGFDSPADMIGIDPLEYVPAENRDHIAAMVADAMFKEDLHKVEELRVMTKDGRETWVRAVGVKTEFQGRLAGLISIKDVADQKRAEERLRDSQGDLRMIFDGVQDGIVLFDAAGKIVRVNKRIVEVGGYAEEEMVGQTFENLKMIAPGSIAEVRSVLKKVLSGEEVGRLEMEICSKSGKKLDVEARISLLRKGDEVVGAIVVVRDITHHRQAEQALRESEKRYRLVAENTSDVICIMNMDLRLNYVSPSVTRLCGYSVEETMAQTSKELLTPSSLDTAMKVLSEEQAAEEKEGKDPHRSRVVEVEVKCKDGSSVWTEVKADFLRDSDGKAIGVLGVARDITERRRVQESQEESESRYRLLAENATDIIWTMDMNQRLTYVSPSVTKQRGYSVQEALATKSEEAMTPESAALAQKAIKELLAAKKKGVPGQDERHSATVDLEMICKNGSTIWTETRMSLVPGVDGRAVGIIGITRDIGERRKAERALLESEKRYRLLAENVSDVIWVTDPNLRPIYISPSVERLLGYTAEEALSSTMEKGLARESAQLAMESITKALSLIKQDPTKTLKPGNVELEFRRKDGSTIWVDTTVTIVRDAKGQPVEVMGVLRDITGRKKSEKALSESEERFRNLIETTSDWVWEVNEKFVYTYVSSKIRDILGYEPEEVVGKGPSDFMPLKEANRVARIFDSALTQKKPFAFVENVCLHKDGRKVVLETSGVPFFDANGNVCGFRGIDRDVTERKRAEEEAQESFRKLQRTVEGTIQAIALTVETRDPYTAGHQRRVTKLAYAMSREMGLPNDQIQRIRIAGLLHDLGKIFIPTEILSKPGQLTEVEFAIIKSHPQAGYEILKNIEFPWPIADIVIQHHERMNGSGYPLGLKDEEIVMEAKILAVADVVEAMSSHRPYRPALGLDKALKEIVNNKGVFYDANAVDACMRVFSGGVFKFDD